MTPVDQQHLHAPANGVQGDCMRASLASVLDMPLASVPHFAQLDVDGEGSFWLLVAEFCRAQGYALAMFAGSFIWADEPVYHLIAGPSPRGGGVNHVVVARNGKVHFDPHPSRAGLAGNPEDWRHYLLVRP